MWEGINEAERTRRLKEAEDDIPYLSMNLFEAIAKRNPELALKILNAHARKGTRDAYQETLDFCIGIYPNLVEDWGLDDVQAAELIGVDPGTWERIKAGDGSVDLRQEHLGRICTLSLIQNRLQGLFINDLHSRWPTCLTKASCFRDGHRSRQWRPMA